MTSSSFYMPMAPWLRPKVPVPAPGAGPPAPLAPGEVQVIHITDLLEFCRCRRSWNWSSQLRRGLQPARTPVPLFFGQAIHVALEWGYRGCVGQDVAYFDLDEATRAFRAWVKERVERTVEYTGPLWDEEKVSLREVRDLGIQMLVHYSLWVEPLDKMFKMLGTEYKFRVPLPGTNLEYGGRFDGLIQDQRSGNIYILEFKTAKSIADNAVSGTLRSMQPAAYTWASGEVYGKERMAKGVLYRFLLKRAPDLPRALQDGRYSAAKSIKSTYAWYQYILHKLAETRRVSYEQDNIGIPVPPLDVFIESEFNRGAAALNLLRQRDVYESGVVVRNDFFCQKALVKTPRQIEDAVRAIVGEGTRMTNSDVPIYPVSGFHCNWCSFKTPCDLVARDMLVEAEAVLEASYGPRIYWEPSVEEEY